MDWLMVEVPVIDVPVIVIAGLIGLWLLLRNRATELDSISDLDAMTGAGEPLVLEFFGKL